jgi:hypothetical protein
VDAFICQQLHGVRLFFKQLQKPIAFAPQIVDHTDMTGDLFTQRSTSRRSTLFSWTESAVSDCAHCTLCDTSPPRLRLYTRSSSERSTTVRPFPLSSAESLGAVADVVGI